MITTSTTYQLDSSANVDNLDETRGHSRFYPQGLSAEMLLDSIDQVTSRPTAYGGLPVGTRAMQLPDENYSNQFLKLFRTPPRESACECERTAAPSLSQSLFSLNDSFLLGKIFDAKSTATALATAGGDHAERIRRCSWLPFRDRQPPSKSKRRSSTSPRSPIPRLPTAI
ncbi:MAG: hypothetical protein CM1200mP2_02860 [Planctomycetaceae bacterium]|nr:MAG: hypothetical protein CM1200mP2_02860 [Planctomycetaceae bacterium]